MMGNNAIYVNQPYPVDGHITTRGSDWYFAVTAIMGATTLGFMGWMFTKPMHDRIFFYITSAITFTASIAYFTMGSNLGYAAVDVEFMRGGKEAGMTRQFFYARYIDWFITTPLLLLDLLLTAGVSWGTIWFTIFLDWVMIITGLIGALVSSRYKWGYFVIGCVAYFGILYNIIIVGRREAASIGADLNRLFLMVSGLTIVLWTMYPIAWGLSEGGNVITSDSEAIFYGILDLLAKPVFGALLLWGHRSIDLERLGLRGRQRWSVTGANAPAGATRV